MEIEKTGKLIAEARREKGMTQKELAALLHVSDRAVSKWERGAGFPDVSLLEKLAGALGLTVTDLLRGERQETPAADSEIAGAIRITRQQLWRHIRANAAAVLLLIFVLWFFFFAFGIADAVFSDKLQKTVTAGVYVAGEKVGETTVEIDGTWWHPPGKAASYEGRFATELVEKTCRNGAIVHIRMEKLPAGRCAEGHLSLWYAAMPDTDTFKNGCYANETMDCFAVMTADGTILATNDHLAELMALYPMTYHLADLGYTHYNDG